MSWSAETSHGHETDKVKFRVAPYVSGSGLDLGCGDNKLEIPKDSKNNCLGVDGGYFSGPNTTAGLLADVTDLAVFSDESFDYVYSSHTLEDLAHPALTLKEWWRVIRPGGRLILYLPLVRSVAKALGRVDWESFYPDKGTPGANVHHVTDFHPVGIKETIEQLGHAELLLDEVRGDKDEYSFLQVYKKLSSSCSPIKSLVSMPKKRALVVRYGAIGDVIQSTPVFAQLKKEGYHVTFNCTDPAREILKHNPNIDEFAVQITDYIPNTGTNLHDYWADMGKGYDKFCNLTGAAEDSLLIADKRVYGWMDEVGKQHPELNEKNRLHNALEKCRAQAGTTNYYDQHLKYAGYDIKGQRGELFFSDSEEVMAQAFRARYPDKFLIMWALAGSSYHKVYPFFTDVVQELCFKHKDIVIVSVGDKESRILERAAAVNYLPRAGKWPLRTSMHMTKYVDLVVGPETGILNAAGCFDTPKLTMLSHSRHENLCQYWTNDYCLAPHATFCYPCHTLHYTHMLPPQPCKACDNTVHDLKEPVNIAPHQGRFTGFWSCPYVTVQGQQEVNFPLCTAVGFPPQRLLARVMEVYNLWKSKKSSPQPNSKLNSINSTPLSSAQ